MSFFRRTLYYFGCKTSLIEPGGFWTHIGDVGALGMKCSQTWQKTSPEIKAEYGEEYVKFSTLKNKNKNNLYILFNVIFIIYI